MLTLFKKELNSYLSSLIAYIVIVLFLVLTGMVLWVFPSSNILDFGFSELTTFFMLCPFILMMIVPAITMRTLSEEYKTGTIEFLLTKPLTIQNVVIGKFLAAWSLIILAIIPTLVYYISVYQLGNPVGNVDSGAVAGSYFGLILLAGVFTAIGVCVSAFTNNQVIAFIVGAFLCYLMYDGLHQTADLFNGKLQYYIDFLSIQFHYSSLGRGVVDSRNLIFLISLIVLSLYIAMHGVKTKK